MKAGSAERGLPLGLSRQLIQTPLLRLLALLPLRLY